MAVIFEYTDRAGRLITVDTEAALTVTEPGREGAVVDLPGYDDPAAVLGLLQGALAASGLGEDYRLARVEAGLGTEEELAAGLALVRRPAAA